jgi:hypothetical protein
MRPEGWRQREKWKDLEGFERLYLISNMGRIKSKRVMKKGQGRKDHQQRRIQCRFKNIRGHAMVKLYDEERKLQQRSVKYLVARQWLRPYYGGKVELKDKEKWYDCSIHNLQEVGVKVDYRSPLNKEQVMVIKQILHDHWNKRGVRAMLARSYNVTKGCITRIAKGERWATLSPSLPPEKKPT